MSAFRRQLVEVIEVDTDAAREQFAKVVVVARKKKRLTQETLASLVGITRGQIANLETGRTWVGIEQFLKLVFVLDLTITKETFR